jgi:hypothetical protein
MAVTTLMDDLDPSGLRLVIAEAQKRLKKHM